MLAAQQNRETLERFLALQVQDQFEARVDLDHQPRGKPPRTFREVVFVKRHDLSHVGDGVLRESCDLGRQKDVARGVEQLGIRTQNQPENRPQSTPVECVGLNNEDGTGESGLRPSRLLEVGPPHVTPFDYHSLLPMLRA